jgi:hypothetical protein
MGYITGVIIRSCNKHVTLPNVLLYDYTLYFYYDQIYNGVNERIIYTVDFNMIEF